MLDCSPALAGAWVDESLLDDTTDKRNVVDTLEEETDDDKSNHGVVKVE